MRMPHHRLRSALQWWRSSCRAALHHLRAFYYFSEGDDCQFGYCCYATCGWFYYLLPCRLWLLLTHSSRACLPYHAFPTVRFRSIQFIQATGATTCTACHTAFSVTGYRSPSYYGYFTDARLLPVTFHLRFSVLPVWYDYYAFARGLIPPTDVGYLSFWLDYYPTAATPLLRAAPLYFTCVHAPRFTFAVAPPAGFSTLYIPITLFPLFIILITSLYCYYQLPDLTFLLLFIIVIGEGRKESGKDGGIWVGGWNLCLHCVVCVVVVVLTLLFPYLH